LPPHPTVRWAHQVAGVSLSGVDDFLTDARWRATWGFCMLVDDPDAPEELARILADRDDA